MSVNDYIAFLGNQLNPFFGIFFCSVIPMNSLSHLLIQATSNSHPRLRPGAEADYEESSHLRQKTGQLITSKGEGESLVLSGDASSVSAGKVRKGNESVKEL